MASSATSQATFTTVDPASGEVLARYALHDDAQIEAALARAQAAFERQRRARLSERTALLRRLATRLREAKTVLATLASHEMGKPIAESEAEVEKCAWCCELTADAANAWLADEVVATDAQRSYVAFRPLGPILAIMPWNFPYWQVFRAAVPALAAGNTLVLKHAPNVCGTALAIERTFLEAGAESGVLGALFIEPERVAGIIADHRVAGVTLTGSTRAGGAVAALAGGHLKKSVLELGGSDPFVVLADADLAAAVATAIRARFQNAGQSCIAAKRFIVERSRYDEFVERFVAAARALRVGDPLDRATQIGPLARADLRDNLARQLAASRASGARLLLGGEPLARPGFFFAPTVLVSVPSDAPALCEETFGPLATIVPARDADHALALANATEYGLGASLWTRDLERAEAFAARIESGAVFVNAMTASDPRIPFGGIKRSGHGRELGILGIREFTNAQTVSIAQS
ncbi:MAG: aldehyde dehydrogenase family protein [Vulcanimicrobiaceae bacterium]